MRSGKCMLCDNSKTLRHPSASQIQFRFALWAKAFPSKTSFNLSRPARQKVFSSAVIEFSDVELTSLKMTHKVPGLTIVRITSF